MKKLLILGLILISPLAYAQTRSNADSVYVVIKSLISPSTTISRTSALDSAAELHAKYLIAGKKSGHYQEDKPQTLSPMRRAEKFGDAGLTVYEVCWAGTPKYGTLPTSDRGAIYYFEISESHWNIMTSAVSQFKEVRFGYSRLETLDWSVCVIIYSVGPSPKLATDK